jgi:alkylation response protein AidB-like acyl-CoA dehydrogenase
MHFDLTEDQKEIKRVAHELLAERSPMARVREAAESAAYKTELWREIVELGWPGIAVAEEYGGQDLGAVELAVLAEELGYACAATPFLSTAVAAAVIQACGSDEQRGRWLPGLVSGELTAGVGSAELAADVVGAAVVVMLDGDDARLLESPEAEAITTIDSTRRYGSVSGGGDPLGPGAADRVRAALSAEVVGISQRALDMTLAYVKDRKQFGVPVGSFQAVSHRCAQMLLHTESVRSAAEGGREVTASAIQAHGGIGFTWEADVHWLYKRAQLDSALLGGARRHRQALARMVAARVALAAH